MLEPMCTFTDLDLLEDDLIDGYIDGLRGGAEPGCERSRAYQQGWESGAVDGGGRPGKARKSLTRESVDQAYFEVFGA